MYMYLLSSQANGNYEFHSSFHSLVLRIYGYTRDAGLKPESFTEHTKWGQLRAESIASMYSVSIHGRVRRKNGGNLPASLKQLWGPER